MFQGVGLLLLLIGAGVFVLLYSMRLKSARVERLAKLYEQALASGRDLSQLRALLEEPEEGDPQGNLKAGIILLACALGMIAGLWAAQTMAGPWRALGFAFVPGCIGLALLYIHYSLSSKA